MLVTDLKAEFYDVIKSQVSEAAGLMPLIGGKHGRGESGGRVGVE